MARPVRTPAGLEPAPTHTHPLSARANGCMRTRNALAIFPPEQYTGTITTDLLPMTNPRLSVTRKSFFGLQEAVAQLVKREIDRHTAEETADNLIAPRKL
jgi:hypothetical protein